MEIPKKNWLCLLFFCKYSKNRKPFHISFPRHEWVVAPKRCGMQTDKKSTQSYILTFPLPSCHQLITRITFDEHFWNSQILESFPRPVGNFVASQVEELRKVREGPLFQTKGELSKLKPRVVKAGVEVGWSWAAMFFLVLGLWNQSPSWRYLKHYRHRILMFEHFATVYTSTVLSCERSFILLLLNFLVHLSNFPCPSPPTLLRSSSLRPGATGLRRVEEESHAGAGVWHPTDEGVSTKPSWHISKESLFFQYQDIHDFETSRCLYK